MVKKIRPHVEVFLCVLSVLCGGEFAAAQTRVTLSVQETAGIRRTQFPARALVPLPQGALRDETHVRLLLGATAVPAQSSAATRWPDGSLRELVVDFNASPGPHETQAYVLEYGDSVAAAAPARGLTVVSEADGVQIGNVRFSSSGTPLITSVKYRDEAIGSGGNGLIVTDAAGVDHDLSAATGVRLDVLKRGPLVAALRYAGTLPLDAATSVPFTLDVEMPSSKSWIKLTVHVDDASRRVKEIAIATPLALGPLPWTWDFGTPRWTYGSFRAAADAVILTSTPGGRPSWSVATGPKGREQPFEAAPASAPVFAGWGHLQGAREVVAFAIASAPEWTGTTRAALDGSGQVRLTLSPAQPAVRHDLVVYEHFVASPVQIGAATSPAAILSPLVVAVQR